MARMYGAGLHHWLVITAMLFPDASTGAQEIHVMLLWECLVQEVLLSLGWSLISLNTIMSVFVQCRPVSYVVNFSRRVTFLDPTYAGMDKMFEWLFLHTLITLARTEA